MVDYVDIGAPSRPTAVLIHCDCLRHGNSEDAKNGAEEELARLACGYEDALLRIRDLERLMKSVTVPNPAPNSDGPASLHEVK